MLQANEAIKRVSLSCSIVVIKQGTYKNLLGKYLQADIVFLGKRERKQTEVEEIKFHLQ